MLQVGCKEVRASQGLIHLLQAVLGAGNHLNQGTFKGNAGGVQLPLLLLTVCIQPVHCCKHCRLSGSQNFAFKGVGSLHTDTDCNPSVCAAYRCGH